MDYIPLNFILSFFVTAVVARWTHIFHNIGMIDKWVDIEDKTNVERELIS